MNDREFLRRARRYARRHRLSFRFDPERGKGSHGMAYLGGRQATVPQGEINRFTLMVVLRQLGINRREF